MSVTLTPQVTLCPQCRTELAVPAIGVGQRVICAACRHRFVPPWLAVVRRVSRKAVASLMLAFASLLVIFLTGIPAIVLGVLALLDIRQHKGHLTGSRLAVCGIVMGAILSVVYVPVWLALAIQLTQMLRPGPGVQEAQIPPATPAIESEQLENGLTVLLRPVQGTENAAVLVLYAVGGDHDPEGQSGLAHLIEHIYVSAAAGATPVRTADEFMRKYPAGWNAQTGDRFTVIATVFPKDSLDAELREAAARMGDLRITAADLNREKPRLIDEIQNMFGGHPPLVAYNNARERIRPTPHGGRKGGLPEHVTAVTRETIQDRWQRYYKPKNATLVVVGAFDPTIVQAMITEHFAKLPAGEPIPPATNPGEPKFSKAIDEVPAKPFQPGAGPELCVAYPALPRDSEGYPAFLVLVGRLSARAQQLDRSPNRFPIDYSALFDPSTLFLTIPIKPGETAEQAVARIDAFLAEAVKSPVAAADRVIAKNRFSFELQTVRPPDFFAAQNLYGFAFTASLRAKLGLDTTDFGKAIDGVTAEQWGQVSQTVLSADRRVAVVATPK